MWTKIATAEMHEGDVYHDVTLRIFTSRGSTPIQIVSNGGIVKAEEIGNQILRAFDYHVESTIISEIRKESAKLSQIGFVHESQSKRVLVRNQPRLTK